MKKIEYKTVDKSEWGSRGDTSRGFHSKDYEVTYEHAS